MKIIPDSSKLENESQKIDKSASSPIKKEHFLEDSYFKWKKILEDDPNGLLDEDEAYFSQLKDKYLNESRFIYLS